MKPLLAHVYEPHRVTFPCFCQPKLNGIRALYQAGRFQSRDEHPFSAELLDHLARPLRSAFTDNIILDGELYVHEWSLQRINGAVTPVRKEEKEDTKKVGYHVFDVVDFNKSFEERCKIRQNGIATIWANSPERQIKNVLTRRVLNEKEANWSYVEFVFEGYEGMMYRLGDCPYTRPKQEKLSHPDFDPNYRARFLSDQDNRCWHLLKRKSWQDDEFICVGVEEGEGKYKDAVGALRCNTRQLKQGTFTEVATFTVSGGLTDLQRAKYWDHPELIIGHQIKVKYLCLSEAGTPLNPTILAIL